MNKTKKIHNILESRTKLKALCSNQTLIKFGYMNYWVATKPVGGNSLRDRIKGALMVLFNKADYVRWW